MEKLRAENAALLQGCDVSQAVMDRIARLERQAAEHASQLREARAANSALAAENLGHQKPPLQEAAPGVARACAGPVQEGRLPAHRPEPSPDI